MVLEVIFRRSEIKFRFLAEPTNAQRSKIDLVVKKLFLFLTKSVPKPLEVEQEKMKKISLRNAEKKRR